MNLFWQITLVESLLNVAVFAGAILAYAPLRAAAARLPHGGARTEGVLVGAVFGAATAGALFLPVHFEGGAAAGCQTVLLALAAPLGGYAAAIAATAVAAAMQLLPWALGHAPDLAAVSGTLVAGAGGTLLRALMSRRAAPGLPRLPYLQLPLLGMVAAAGSLAALWLWHSRNEAAAAALPALGSSIGAALVLGTLLLHERRRVDAERSLRESEARLAGQARELAQSRGALADQAQALAVALARAESASQAKSAFLANMSHELRTPLNAILGYAQLLRRDRALDGRQLAAAATIQQSGEHLLTLITDILDLSKIEAGKLELAPGPADLPAFLQGVADIMRIRAEDKAVAFRFEATGLPRFTEFDEKRLRQVLLNLLGNAVKFTDQGEVALLARLLGADGGAARLRFEVLDTGVGIAAHELPAIFRPFEQVGEATRRAGGTGLGLSISRELVQLMGGEIAVESAPGRGSRFWFELLLPLAATAAPQAGKESAVSGYEGPRRSILVVDDKAANRAMLAELLQELGFVVRQAGDGGEALQQALAAPPDAVLMDVRMPVMDGLEATRRMRQAPTLARLPVIAVSAGSGGDDAAACRAAGCDAFLSKPVMLDDLIGELGGRLGLNWRREALAASAAEPAAMVPPPAPELEALHELALAGNMRAVRQRAEHIAALDPRFQTFAEKLRQLAQTYQSRALLGLVQQYMQQAKVQS